MTSVNLLFSLPKVLQDIVLEYNVDHRPMFNLVVEQLNRRYFLVRNSSEEGEQFCDDCYEYIIPDEVYMMVFIAYTPFKCCNNIRCLISLEDDIRKRIRRNI